MKEYKILYLKETATPSNPDAGYRKLYPKSDGWYILDSAGNEIKVEGLVVRDHTGTLLTQRSEIEILAPLTAIDDDGKIKIGVGAGDLQFAHNNDFHTENYATEAALQTHLDDPQPHGIVLANIHEQNTDTVLDQGGANEVTAAELKALADTVAASGLLKTSDAEHTVDGSYSDYIGDGAANHVFFVLPEATSLQTKITFRHGGGGFTVNVERSGTDLIDFNGNDWEGVTLDSGQWFSVISDGTKWYIITDSGLTAANEIV